MQQRNDAKSALRDEEYPEAIALALVALYDLAVEVLSGKFETDLRSHEPPRTEPRELEQDQPASHDES